MSTQFIPLSLAENQATELYLGFFNRAPDTAGLSFWTNQLVSGTSVLDVAQGFAQTAEFASQYTNLDHSHQVSLIYSHVLERAPDAGGLAYWTSILDQGASVGTVVWNLVNAAFTQVGTGDGLLVQSRVASNESLANAVVANTPVTSWNPVSGFGEINVANAISAATNTALTQGTPVKAGQSAWQLGAAHFQDAWAAGYTGKGVVIAEIDTGVDLSNAALTQNLSTKNWNFVNNSANVQDDNGHGTAVASLMIASAGQIIAGGAYDAQLMVLKALDSNGNGTEANLISAINYAVANGANVINLSIGSATPDAAELAALTNAANHGVIVCMAAGNSSAGTAQYPANYAQQVSTSIAVGSTALNADGSTLAFNLTSNAAGSKTAYNYIDAPGVHVLAYGLNGVMQTWTGTSFAAPLVAAEVADVLSAHTGLSATQVVQAVVNTTISLVGTQTVIA